MTSASLGPPAGFGGHVAALAATLVHGMSAGDVTAPQKGTAPNMHLRMRLSASFFGFPDVFATTWIFSDLVLFFFLPPSWTVKGFIAPHDVAVDARVGWGNPPFLSTKLVTAVAVQPVTGSLTQSCTSKVQDVPRVLPLTMFPAWPDTWTGPSSLSTSKPA